MILIKTPEQIEGIRKSCRLAAQTLDFLDAHISDGVTTGEIDRLAETYIRDHGAIPAPLGYKGYPKSTCISLNEVICHGIPDNRVILPGDILNVDVTTILDGYYGDTSRMYAISEGDMEPSDEATSLMEVAFACLWRGIEQVKPGTYFSQIGRAIETYANQRGYSVVHQFCGHGTGVEFHEEPNVLHFATMERGPRMKPGMIFTVEPMINVGVAEAVLEADGWTAKTADGKLSAQNEHTILVTETGCEVLTESKNG